MSRVFSDSESSAGEYDSPSDYNLSDDEVDDEDDDLVLDDVRNKSLKEGISLLNSAPTDTPSGKATMLSTQPASQVSSTKKRRSPRKSSAVATTLELSSPQVSTKPMKKRKVSLSPTDSLAKQHYSRLLNPEQKKDDMVIDLLDDDDNEISKAKASTSIPSPSILAAAQKQQQEHIANMKQKKEKGAVSKTKAKSTKTSTPSKAKQSAASEEPKNVKSKTNKPATEPKEPKAKKPAKATKSKAKQKAASLESQEETATTATKAAKAKTTAKATKSKAKMTAKATKSKAKEKAPAAGDGNEDVTETKVKATAKATKSNAKAPKTEATAPKAEPKKAAVAAAKPKPKKKTKRLTFEEDLIVKMFMSCRPYAIKDLVKLMGPSTSEASVNFCMLSLIDKAWVCKKEFTTKSRSKELYWANQDAKDPKLWALDGVSLASMDKIKETRIELAALQQREKSIVREITALEQAPSNEALKGLCEASQKEVDELTAKLNAAKARIASATASISTNKKPGLGNNRIGGGRFGNKKAPPKKRTQLQVKKKINAMRDHWIKRKRKCMDFVDALADGMEKKVQDVVNKVLELETDEAEGVKLPPKHAV